MRVEISRPATSRTSARAARRRAGAVTPPPPRSGAATASRNSSTSVGSRQAKWVDPAGAQRGGEHRLVVGAVGQLQQRCRRACSETTRTPGSAAAQPAAASGTTTRSSRPASRRAQLLDGAGGHHPAAGEDADRVAEPLDQVELVAGEHDRHARAGLLEQRLGEGVDADRVEAGERLVEDEHLGSVHQRGGQLDALLVAQRQLLHRVAAALAEPEPLEPARRRRARPRRASRPCSRAK